MKRLFLIIALILIILAALALLSSCKKDILDSFSSDTYEIGEEDPISWGGLFGISDSSEDGRNLD